MAPSDYVKAMARRWWIVVLLALLAAGGAYVATRNTADAQTATVDITVPSDQSGTAGANGQYVENFSVALTSPSALSEISHRTHVSQSDLADNLTASQLGNSSFIGVSYVSSSATRAASVVKVAAKATAVLLENPAIQSSKTLLSSARHAVGAAQNRIKSAQRAFDTYTAKYGRIDPSVLYQSAQSSLTQLSVSKQQASAQGHDTSNFDTAIAAARRKLNVLGPQIATYSDLSRQVNQAELAGQAVQTRLESASQQLAAAKTAPLVGAVSRSTQTANSVILKAVVIAAGIGFVLGLALVLLLALLRGDRHTPAPRSAKRPHARGDDNDRDDHTHRSGQGRRTAETGDTDAAGDMHAPVTAAHAAD